MNVSSILAGLPTATVSSAVNSWLDVVIELGAKAALAAVVVFLIYRVIKTKFAISAIVTALVAAGLFLWAIAGGGYIFIKDRVTGQVNQSASSVILVDESAPALEL